MRNLFFVGVLIIMGLLIESCSLGSKKPRGSLSEAMEKASDDNKGERVVETGITEYEDEDEDQQLYVSYSDQDTLHDSLTVFLDDTVKQSELNTWFGLMVGSGFISDNSFDRINQVFLTYTFGKDNMYFQVNGGYAWAPVNSSSETGSSISSPLSMLKFGLEINYYTTPEYTFLGNRLIGGLSFGAAYWNYKNAILIEHEGYTEEINSDFIGQFELYVGSGINLAQTEWLNIGIYVLGGLYLYEEVTDEGFENDYFDPSVYLKLGVSMDIK